MVQRVSKKISELDPVVAQTNSVMMPAAVGTETFRVEMPFPGAVASLAANFTGSQNVELLQAAIDSASARHLATGVTQTVTVPPGGPYKIQLTNTAAWTLPLNGSTTTVSIAVSIKSGVALLCRGATFAPIPPVGGNAAWYYALFGSASLNLSVTALTDVRISEATFEMSPSYWTLATTAIFGVMAVGVSGLVVDGATCKSSGAQNGRLIRAMNCENISVRDLRGENVTQVAYFAYVTGLEFSGVVDGFTEAFDLDQPTWDVRCNVDCRNGTGEAQCLDIASCVNGQFSLTCQNVGNAFIVYSKPECWATFSDWVTNFPLGSAGWSPAPVIAQNISVIASGDNIHHATNLRSFQVSLDRGDSGFGTYWDGKGPMVLGLTLNVRFTDCDMALVYECRDISGSVKLAGVTTGSTNRINNAGLILRQSSTGANPIADSELTGSLTPSVENSSRTGIRISGGEGFSLLDPYVDGYNSANDATSGVASGIWWENLARKNGMACIRRAIVKNGDTTVAPVDLRFTWDGSTGVTRLHDLGGHRLTTVGGTPASLASNSEQYLQGQVSRVTAVADTTVATGAATVDVVLMTAASGFRTGPVAITNLLAIVGDAVNFSTVRIARSRAGAVATIGTVLNYDAVAKTAGAVVVLDGGTDADGLLLSGDVLILRFVRQGNGSANTQLDVRVTGLEYSIT